MTFTAAWKFGECSTHTSNDHQAVGTARDGKHVDGNTTRSFIITNKKIPMFHQMSDTNPTD